MCAMYWVQRIVEIIFPPLAADIAANESSGGKTTLW